MPPKDDQDKSLFDKWAPIVTPLIATGLAYMLHLDMANQIGALKQNITENYELKSAHDADINQIRSNEQRMWEGQKELQTGQNDIKLNVQKLADAIPSRPN